MSIENNTTSSDIQKPKILTPDEKIAKIDKDKTDLIKWTKNSIEVKKITNVNDSLEDLAKHLNILEIPDNLENRIRKISKNTKFFGVFKININRRKNRDNFSLQVIESEITKIEKRIQSTSNTKEEKKENIVSEDVAENKKDVVQSQILGVAWKLEGVDEARGFVEKILELEKSWNFDKKEWDKALNYLRKPKVLKQIAKELKQNDKENWTKSFDSFKNAVSFDPQISIILDSFEAKAGGVSGDTIGKLSAGVSGVKGSVDGDIVSFESGGAVVNSDKWMTTLSLKGSDYAMESNPEEVNENLARAKKIREKASEEVEPLAKNIFGLESLIKVIEQNSDNFEKLKTALWDINSEIYKNIPDNQKNSIKNMVESSNTPMDLIAKIMVFKNPWFSAYLTPHIYKI